MSEVVNRTIGVGSCYPHPENSNQHDYEQITYLRESLRTFGQVNSIVVQDDGHGGFLLVAGHGVHMAAKAEGFETLTADVIPTDWPSERVLAYSEVDNESGRQSDPDLAQLSKNLQSLKEVDETLARLAAGTEERLRELVEWAGNGKPPEDPGPQIDKAAELQEKWEVETGDLWVIPSKMADGEHRVVCGDCTDGAVVERVMGDEEARMIFTDPPYGIGKDIENDDLKHDARVEFYRQWSDIALDHVIDNAYVYVWGYFDTLSDYWQEVIKPRQDCNFRNFIIWQKTFIQGRNAPEFRQFPEHYEACLLFIFGQPFQNGPWSTTPNAEHYWAGYEPIRAYLDGERKKMGWDIPTVKKIVGHSDLARDHWFNRSQWSMPTREVYEALQQAANHDAFRKDYDELRKDYDELRGYFDNSNGFTDLWKFDELTTTEMHPTVKPVEVCERGIISTSQAGDIVLDVFLGSGSTLLACERLARLGRGVEIESKYVSVTLERLQQMGLQPKLAEPA